MEDFKIELATDADSDEIFDLIRISFNEFDFFYSDGLVALIEECGVGGNDVKLTVNEKIVGFHSLCKGKIEIHENCSFVTYDYLEDLSAYKDKKGLEGIILCIHPDYRRKGYGSAMIKFEKEFFKDKFDYIFGGQDGRLENIDFWKKHRRVICETTHNGKVSFDTLMDL